MWAWRGGRANLLQQERHLPAKRHEMTHVAQCAKLSWAGCNVDGKHHRLLLLLLVACRARNNQHAAAFYMHPSPVPRLT